MTQAEIHEKLKDDLAYQYSVVNGDALNMRKVLRAYDLPFDYTVAEQQVQYAQFVRRAN